MTQEQIIQTFMKTINAQVVADSISPQGHRIISMLVTHPRFILAELNTHRLFSRNSASSRAIPFKKMVEMVEEDLFIPIAWQKDHKGMQGNEYWDKEESDKIDLEWLQARNKAVYQARMLNYAGVTKQIANRLLEPFMWHTTLITATEWDNFFKLRCPTYIWEEPSGNPHVYRSKKEALKDIQGRGYDISELLHQTDVDWQKMNISQAEIHIQALAEAMWDAMNESTPKKLRAGEWHIPFGDNIEMSILDQRELAIKYPDIKSKEDLKIRIATARCARLSYMTHDGEIDYEKDIRLHDSLLQDKHMSPFEHCAMVMDDLEYQEFVKTASGTMSYQWELGWCNNFRGFIQYRFYIENGGI